MHRVVDILFPYFQISKPNVTQTTCEYNNNKDSATMSIIINTYKLNEFQDGQKMRQNIQTTYAIEGILKIERIYINIKYISIVSI